MISFASYWTNYLLPLLTLVKAYLHSLVLKMATGLSNILQIFAAQTVAISV
jgi:hypothetical protein